MLTFGELEAWRAWQRRQRGLLRAVQARVAPSTPDLAWFAPAVMRTWTDVAIALDAPTPSQHAALLAPLPILRSRGADVVVLAPRSCSSLLEGYGLTEKCGFDVASSPRAHAFLSVGHHLDAGAALERIARAHDRPTLVVQHGVLTPWSPPPPPSATVACWNNGDATFLAEGRGDLAVEVVGGQLLFEAAALPRPTADVGGNPIFLGQLHGAELARSTTIATVDDLAARTSITYRPHPAEVDRRSRRQHRRWEAAGIEIDWSKTPVRELDRPIVSIFSTGILEAAAAGLPAFGACAAPPPWVEELWQRYAIVPFGTADVTSMPVGPGEPAAAIAELLANVIG